MIQTFCANQLPNNREGTFSSRLRFFEADRQLTTDDLRGKSEITQSYLQLQCDSYPKLLVFQLLNIEHCRILPENGALEICGMAEVGRGYWRVIIFRN